ncbi:MAG: hypothetical protein RLZZ301_709 [Bacteroidota bacterium]|jgi:hypothetical protein
MEFVHPERLWLLGLLLIPILIHLFHFRRQKILFFPSLKFIQFMEQENKSVRKIKHLLVLAARLLALLFLILCFCMPYLPLQKQDKGGKPVLAIYIDNSFSMNAIGAEGELLSEARELAKRMLQQTPLETRILIHTNKLDGVEARLMTRAEAQQYIDRIESCPIQRQTGEIIAWQQDFLARESKTHQRISSVQSVLISDFQKSSASLQNAQPDSQHYYSIFQLQAQHQSNCYIDSVWFDSPVHKFNELSQLHVRVCNSGQEAVRNLELNVTIGKQQRSSFLDLAVGQHQETSFPYTEKKHGYIKGSARISDRQLYWDDEFFFAYQTPSSAKVCVINGPDASTRVARVFAVEPFYQVQEVSENSITYKMLEEAALIVCNGLNEIPSGLRADLQRVHSNGATVLLIPGPTIETTDYQSLCKELHLPALAASYTDGLRISKIHYTDPFFNGVFEKENANLQVASVKKAYRVQAAQSSNSIPLIEFRNGAPLFLRADQHTFLLSTALQESFGQLVGTSLFPTILLRCGEFATQAFPLYAQIGKDAAIPMRMQHQNEGPIRLSNGSASFIPQHKTIDGQTRLSIAGMEAVEALKAGTYVLENEDSLGLLAVNYTRQESDLQALTSQELEAAFAAQGLKNCTFNSVKEGQSLTHVQIDKPTEYWRLFLVLALLMIGFELALLNWWK